MTNWLGKLGHLPERIDTWVDGVSRAIEGRIRSVSKSRTRRISSLLESSMGGQLGVKGKVYPKADLHDAIKRFVGWVYACVRHNAEGTAGIPLRLYTSRRPGGKVLDCWGPCAITKEQLKWLKSSPDVNVKRHVSRPGELLELTKHAFLDSMQRANPLDTGFELLELLVDSMDLTGWGLWYVEPNPFGAPARTWPLMPQWATPIQGKNKILESYEYGVGRNKQIFPAKQVVRFRYPSLLSRLHGYAPLQAGDMASVLETLMMKYNRALLENDARPDFFLTTPGRVDDDVYNRFIEKWLERFQTMENRGVPALLEGGVDVHELGWSPRELMAPQYMKEVKALICAIFAVPLAMVEMTSASRASAETAEYSHQKHAVLPRCRRIQGVLNLDYLPRWGDNKLFAAFDNPVTADDQTQARVRRINLESDFSVPNEERRLAGRAEIDEPWANKPASERRASRTMRAEATGSTVE